MSGRQPERFMVDRVDHYEWMNPATRDTAGGTVNDYTLATEGIRCKMFDPSSNLFDEYLQRDLISYPYMILIDRCIFDSIDEKDLITFKGDWYRVKGKRNLAMLDCVYRVDLVSVVTPSFIGQ
jgi:hypothetical protein